MLRGLPAPLIGLLTGSVVLIHITAVFVLLVLPPALLKLLVPHPPLRRRCSLAMNKAGYIWGRNLYWIIRVLHSPRWRIEGVSEVVPGRSYFLICNHQSWADIIVLAAIMQDRIPFFRFFIKYELLWVPIIGFACWAMDCPFMKRHSKAAIARNPQLALEDIQTTRESCRKLREIPVTMVDFVEGTRFSPKKQAAQGAEFTNLLRPKSGGAALVLNSMGDQLHGLLDMTIVYPQGAPSDFWQFLCGRLDPLHVDIRQRPIPPELCSGDYLHDTEYRSRFQAWLNGLWIEKDVLISRIHARDRG